MPLGRSRLVGLVGRRRGKSYMKRCPKRRRCLGWFAWSCRTFFFCSFTWWFDVVSSSFKRYEPSVSSLFDGFWWLYSIIVAMFLLVDFILLRANSRCKISFDFWRRPFPFQEGHFPCRVWLANGFSIGNRFVRSAWFGWIGSLKPPEVLDER